MKNFSIIFSKSSLNLFKINIALVTLFAIIYWLIDYFIIYYPNFSNKYLLENNNSKKLNNDNSEKSNKPIYSMKSFLYYLWFSLITQTTVGYTTLVSFDGTNSFENNRSIPFKIVNILQLLSIFLLPIIII